MYQDVSARISEPVFQKLGKGMMVFKDLLGQTGAVQAISSGQRLSLRESAEIIERLFVWDEDELGDDGDFPMLLCRSLGWYQDVITVMETIGHDTPECFREITETCKNIVSGFPVNPEYLEESYWIFQVITGSIWDYFAANRWKLSEN